MHDSYGKYKAVYTHLWNSYGKSWKVRIAYMLQIAKQVCKLIFQPIALSLIITRLSAHNFDGAMQAVMVYVALVVIFGV